MFVHNRSDSPQNHAELIETKIREADEVCLAVSYVTKSGVDMFLEALKGKRVRLICTFEMGITELEAIQRLLQEGVIVKVYHSSTGTFHPKLWLFRKGQTWTALVGSANLTRGGLVSNTEVGTFLEGEEDIKRARQFFQTLWNGENAKLLSKSEAEKLREVVVRRNTFKRKIISSVNRESTTEDKFSTILESIKSWIDIDVSVKTISSPGNRQTAYWRGWYIVPDHYKTDDKIVMMLKGFLSHIKGDFELNGNNPTTAYQALLKQFEKESEFKRKTHRTTLHKRFVRQAKKYMKEFGWIEEAGKRGKISFIRLTSLGERVRDASSVEEVKDIYTKYFWNRRHHGIHLVRFVKALLERLGYIKLEEFSYFVFHVYDEDDLEVTAQLIRDYRSLNDSEREDLHAQVKALLRLKEKTDRKAGTGAVMNYDKKIKYGLRVLAWCNYFTIDDELTVRLAEGRDDED